MLSAKAARNPEPARPDLAFPAGAPAGGAIQTAIARSRDWLFSKQHPDGWWCGELEADSMLEADYIFLHKLYDTGDAGRLRRALAETLRCQKEDGSWSLYPGGPGNISLAVKCYFACKLMGMSAADPRLVKARAWILAHGGVVECNTFTKIYLCYLGQYDFDAVPAIPPELILFPNWFYFNIYEISSWSRGILVPLAILFDKKPFKPLPPEQGIGELFVGGREHANLRLRWDKQLVSWRNFFLTVDRGLHWLENAGIKPLRRLALRRAEQWTLERLEMSAGLGAIYPAMLNSIIALRALGYGEDHPQVIRARREFEALGIEVPPCPEAPEGTFQMQPVLSPVWDTAQAIYALGEAGVPPDDPRMVKAGEWLLDHEVRHLGDWAIKVPNTEPSGWYFEFANEFYPDTDDTAQVLLALSKVESPNPERKFAAIDRALRWEFAMQCREGGWGSFDKDCTKVIFESIPFADHNAMLDVPTADITGRMLETLAVYGYTLSEPRVQSAIRFILSLQEPDGSWFGRWGVNYVYGTWLSLRGLAAIGYDPSSPAMQRGADFLRRVQRPDGGWGETCGTYDDPSTRGHGPSTPAQTAWGVMGLIAAGDTTSPSLLRGLAWLTTRQRPDGSWDESTGEGFSRQALYTATGFPKVFYLAYHLYRQYFPLLALTSYGRAVQGAS